MSDKFSAYLFGELFRELARDDFSKQEFANKLWILMEGLDFCEEDMRANEALKKFGLARQTDEKEDDEYIWEYGPTKEVKKEALLKCEDLYIKLHREIREGRTDDSYADKIRDELDYYYCLLDEDDKRLINNISGDLYFLNKRKARFVQKQQIKPDNNPWENVLIAFRNFQILSLADFKIIGTCYSNLGFDKVAKCFFDFVEDPENAMFVSLGLSKCYQNE